MHIKCFIMQIGKKNNVNYHNEIEIVSGGKEKISLVKVRTAHDDVDK